MLSFENRQQYQSLLDATALEGGHGNCIIYLETGKEPKIISRTMFRKHSFQYASALIQNGIQANDLVFIATTQILESIYAFWGAMLIGAIPSIFPTLTKKLDPKIYANNLAELVRNSDVRAILTTEDFLPHLDGIVTCEVFSIATLAGEVIISPTKPDPTSVAFLQHSSGTTGLQKGVSLSHEAVLNQLAAYSERLKLNVNDVIVSWLPLYHDMGLIAGFLLPLVQGIPLVLMSPFDWVAHPAMLLQAIHEYQGTLCWLPNFAYNHVARRVRKGSLGNIHLDSMRAFINCSEPVRADSHQQFLERFHDYGISEAHFAVSYAMAENTFAVTQTQIGNSPPIDFIDQAKLEEEKVASLSQTGIPIVSCGIAIANTMLQIIDDGGIPIPERHIGEIIIKSDCMLNAYYKRPDLQPFTDDGWYLTGDMGYIADGELYIVGRKKDIIINAGKNIYPQDIEAIVNKLDGIHAGRCVVFGIQDEREGTELIAVVAETDNNPSLDIKMLAKQVKQIIAQQSSVTAAYVTLVEREWLIKTSSGKIARQANRSKWLQEFGI